MQNDNRQGFTMKFFQNAVQSSGNILLACASVLSTLQQVEAEYRRCSCGCGSASTCSCGVQCDTCYDDKVCTAYERLGRDLQKEALQVYAETMALTNVTDAQRAAYFEEEWLIESDFIIDEDESKACKNSTNNIASTLLNFALPIAMTLGFAGIYLKKFAKSSDQEPEARAVTYSK